MVTWKQVLLLNLAIFFIFLKHIKYCSLRIVAKTLLKHCITIKGLQTVVTVGLIETQKYLLKTTKTLSIYKRRCRIAYVYHYKDLVMVIGGPIIGNRHFQSS